MRDFEYTAPTTIDEAVQAFAGANGNAKALVGGTDLIDQIRIGRRTPELVIDMKRIPELNVLEYSADSGLRIGAAVSCTRVHTHPDVAANYPGIAIPSAFIGSVQIQNRASIGGNIGNAAPSGDTIPPLVALDATVTIAGPRGQREEPLEGIFAGPGQLTLQPDEFLVDVKVPPPPPRSSSYYLRFIPRAEMDIAVAGGRRGDDGRRRRPDRRRWHSAGVRRSGPGAGGARRKASFADSNLAPNWCGRRVRARSRRRVRSRTSVGPPSTASSW